MSEYQSERITAAGAETEAVAEVNVAVENMQL